MRDGEDAMDGQMPIRFNETATLGEVTVCRVNN